MADIKQIKLNGNVYKLKDARIPAPQEVDKDKYLHLNETTGAFEWDSPRGNVADVKQNGVSVVDVQGNANVTVPTKTSDITNDSGYITSAYHDNTKQDVIEDLETIREGAGLGATAVQPETGKGLSSNDYTDADKELVGTALQPNDSITNLADDASHRTVSDAEKATWNEKQSALTPDVDYATPTTVQQDISDATADMATQTWVGEQNYITAEDIPVLSVNGKTGTVVLDAEDVSALPDDTFIPSKTSDLENDARFVDEDYHDITKQDVISDLAAIRSNASAGAGIVDKVSAQASTTNKLVSASEMGDAIASVEAKQLYATNAQGSFATKADLTSATTFYNADGTVATPTKNDVAYVLSDESHDGKSTKYVVASVNPLVWGFVISFSAFSFTQAQMDAINSNITNAKRQGYDSHVANESIHVTEEEKEAWDAKQNAISDLATIRSGAEAGATAVQPAAIADMATKPWVEDKGYIDATYHDNTKQDKINDLATIRNGAALGATAVQPEAGKGLFSGNYNDLSNKPTIPAAQVNSDWNATSGVAQILNKPAIPAEVTESTVAGWGFTKNTGTYSKPSTGIPKTDLASTVQTSLGKADSALQSYTETDPVFVASPAHGITSSDITNWNNKGTVTSVAVKMNGTTKGTVTTSGTIDLGTVLTAHQSLSAYYTSAQTDTAIANAIGVAIGGAY